MVNKSLNSEHKSNIEMPADCAEASVARDTSRADAIFLGVLRLMRDMDCPAITETPLSNSRRADVMALSRRGDVLIVEVKSCLSDFASDAKWPDYLDFCDQFYFAVNEDFPQARLPQEAGLIVADAFGGAIIRTAAIRRLAPARRKALTLNFARLAARRLNRDIVPDMA